MVTKTFADGTDEARTRQRGMSMIELLIAMTVLAIGVSGILAMVLLAIASNGRTKGDSTATMLAQMVIEQAEAVPSNGVVSGVAGNVNQATVFDCTGAARVIRLTPGGANLLANGAIDWTQAPGAVQAGYQMNFAACLPNNTAGVPQSAAYDVRWNIRNVGPAAPTRRLSHPTSSTKRGSSRSEAKSSSFRAWSLYSSHWATDSASAARAASSFPSSACMQATL